MIFFLINHYKNKEKKKEGMFLPRNENNSCFIDSLMVALFFIPSKTVDEFIVKSRIPSSLSVTQKLLHHIRQQVGGTQRYPINRINLLIARLRSTLSNEYYSFATDEQHDAAECMAALLQACKIDVGMGYRVVNTYMSHDIAATVPRKVAHISKHKDDIGVMLRLPVSELRDNMLNYINDDVLETQYKGFSRKFTHIETYPGRMIVLHLDRYVNSTKKNSMAIFRNKQTSFKLDGTHMYTLLSLVLHTGNAHGGHYTTVVCKDDWYCYDDLHAGLKHVDAIDFQHAQRNTVLCLFVRQE